MKQAYMREWLRYGMSDYRPVTLTGYCKTISGGIYTNPQRYIGVQRKFLGIPLGTRWVHEGNIYFFEPLRETIQPCGGFTDV